MKKSILLIVLVFILSGCVLLKDSATARNPSPSPGLQPIQAQAIEAYEHGVHYMGQRRYLLAREKFSEAASMAVTQCLYDDALASMVKADTILQKRRTSHE